MPSERVVRYAVLVCAVLTVTAVASALLFAAAPAAEPVDHSYLGARLLPGGPAVGGLPLVPVRVNPAGFLEGVPSHLQWYSYCRDHMPGLDEHQPVPNAFTYSIRPERIHVANAQGIEVWFEPLLGEHVRATDFTEDWQGAHVKWRTAPGSDPGDELNAIVLKVPPGTYPSAVEAEFAPDGFVAFNQDDTHFCCQVGWRMTNSTHARSEDGFDLLYESCHRDRYDPRSIASYDMPPGGRHDD